MEENQLYYIYKITNLVNNKKYIGKSYDVFNRIDTHLNNAFSDAKYRNTECPKFYNSLRIHGVENFIFEIIDVFDNEKFSYLAEEGYTYFYDTVKNGLNTIYGGNGFMSGKLNPMYGKGFKGELNPMFGMTGDKNPFFGKKHTEESKKQMSKNSIGTFAGEKNYFYGKSFAGEKHHNVKITEETAKLIIELNKTMKPREIVKKLNVTTDTIGAIKSNKTWKYLPR